MSKEVAKSDIVSGIIQMWIFAILGAIAIIGIIKDNAEVWQTALYALGFTGAGYVVKTVSGNSKVFKAVQSWIGEHTPGILDIFAKNRVSEVITEDAVVERAVATNSNLVANALTRLEEMELKLGMKE